MLKIAWRDWRKQRKVLVMVADNQVEIRIGYFLNTKEKKN
jgi:hypothetical protein